jgi:hypothetical protein
MTDISQNIILNPQPIDWPPIFLRCDLCDFETTEIPKIKKHILTKEHREKEKNAKREKLAWFWYFGKLENHLKMS